MNIENIKIITRPVMIFLLLSAWISFIGCGISYPDVFQWLVVTGTGEWILERGYKRVTEIRGYKNGRCDRN